LSPQVPVRSLGRKPRFACRKPERVEPVEVLEGSGPKGLDPTVLERCETLEGVYVLSASSFRFFCFLVIATRLRGRPTGLFTDGLVVAVPGKYNMCTLSDQCYRCCRAAVVHLRLLTVLQRRSRDRRGETGLTLLPNQNQYNVSSDCNSPLTSYYGGDTEGLEATEDSGSNSSTVKFLIKSNSITCLFESKTYSL